MRFEVLGPLQVASDTRTAVPVTRRRLRELMSVLLLNANQPVPARTLSEMLHDGEVPWSDATLRGHILQLRMTLRPADRIHTISGSYKFEVHPGELDREEFQDLYTKGRDCLRADMHEKAEEYLAAACHLWREPPLADIPATEAMKSTVDQLMDQRSIAEEMLVDSRLASGQHRELIAELSTRSRSNPTNEKVWRQLILALYRSERKAEVFEVYAQLRKTLAEEYGVDPGRRLQELYEQVLHEDPSLEYRPQLHALPHRSRTDGCPKSARWRPTNGMSARRSMARARAQGPTTSTKRSEQ